jgi:hypothetical protein
MKKGFLMYEEMRKYFPIYEEAVSHVWLCNCSILNFLIMRKIWFTFLSVHKIIIRFFKYFFLFFSLFARSMLAFSVTCIQNSTSTATMGWSINSENIKFWKINKCSSKDNFSFAKEFQGTMPICYDFTDMMKIFGLENRCSQINNDTFCF